MTIKRGCSEVKQPSAAGGTTVRELWIDGWAASGTYRSPLSSALSPRNTEVHSLSCTHVQTYTQTYTWLPHFLHVTFYFRVLLLYGSDTVCVCAICASFDGIESTPIVYLCPSTLLSNIIWLVLYFHLFFNIDYQWRFSLLHHFHLNW